MTLEALETQVNEAVSSAFGHAIHCGELIQRNQLFEAIGYCKRQGVEPPQCSLTAQSENANRLRKGAARKLSDPNWWGKSLEVEAIRSYEAQQIVSGNVRNFVSDASLEYRRKHKARM